MRGNVSALAKGGEGLVRVQGETHFVYGALPGEEVEFSPGEKRRGVYHSSLVEVITPVPGRRTPPCRLAGRCGGCNLQHAQEGLQMKLKGEILLGNLARIGRWKPSIPLEHYPSPSAFGYRTRTLLRVRKEQAGYYERMSHTLVEATECPLLPEASREYLRSLSLKGLADGTLALISNGRECSASFQEEGTDLWKPLDGSGEIEFLVGPYRYLYRPCNFIQSNLSQLATMVGLVDEELTGLSFPSGGELFAGTGFFTLPLASKCKGLLCWEEDRENVLSLKKNLCRNGLEGVEVLRHNLYSQRVDLPERELYLADPPRSGLGEDLVNMLLKAKPKRLILFSCDSASLARDLVPLLRGGYVPQRLALVDNFPQTDHGESFLSLAYPEGR